MDYRFFFPKKIITWVPREARGGSKQQQVKGNKLTITLSKQFFVTFCFFQPECCFPCKAMLETISPHRHGLPYLFGFSAPGRLPKSEVLGGVLNRGGALI